VHGDSHDPTRSSPILRGVIGYDFHRREILIFSVRTPEARRLCKQGGRVMAEISAATKPSSDPEKPPPSAAARRMRRHRERRRRGLRHLSIELRACEIEAFIRRKRLSPEDRDNPNALRRMLYEYLDDTLW
jgi:hypothetical protein